MYYRWEILDSMRRVQEQLDQIQRAASEPLRRLEEQRVRFEAILRRATEPFETAQAILRLQANAAHRAQDELRLLVSGTSALEALRTAQENHAALWSHIVAEIADRAKFWEEAAAPFHVEPPPVPITRRDPQAEAIHRLTERIEALEADAEDLKALLQELRDLLFPPEAEDGEPEPGPPPGQYL